MPAFLERDDKKRTTSLGTVLGEVDAYVFTCVGLTSVQIVTSTSILAVFLSIFCFFFFFFSLLT